MREQPGPDQSPTGGPGDLTSDAGGREEPEVEDAFDRLVTEGRDRLARPLLPLLTTSFVGGIDVGIGVLTYLVVRAETGNTLLASLAFPVGFVALLMARSELFTENFLVPVTASRDSPAATSGPVSQSNIYWPNPSARMSSLLAPTRVPSPDSIPSQAGGQSRAAASRQRSSASAAGTCSSGSCSTSRTSSSRSALLAHKSIGRDSPS